MQYHRPICSLFILIGPFYFHNYQQINLLPAWYIFKNRSKPGNVRHSRGFIETSFIGGTRCNLFCPLSCVRDSVLTTAPSFLLYRPLSIVTLQCEVLTATILHDVVLIGQRPRLSSGEWTWWTKPTMAAPTIGICMQVSAIARRRGHVTVTQYSVYFGAALIAYRCHTLKPMYSPNKDLFLWLVALSSFKTTRQQFIARQEHGVIGQPKSKKTYGLCDLTRQWPKSSSLV